MSRSKKKTSYDYCLCMFGAVWAGIHVLVGLLWFLIAPWIWIAVLVPVIYVICLMSFNIILVKIIAQVRGYDKNCC